MKEHRPELADVFRTYQSDFLAGWNRVLSRQQRKALQDIQKCRTAALGGHLHKCDRCGHRVLLYNSCRNRHCPKCQATARARWLEQRQTELLPVPYFHVVFTVPQSIGQLALQNARTIYNILFRAAAQTLLETAKPPFGGPHLCKKSPGAILTQAYSCSTPRSFCIVYAAALQTLSRPTLWGFSG